MPDFTGASRDDTSRLARLDHAHLWHPFTQMKGWTESEPVIIAEGSGVWLTDTRGRRYIDGISSMWCNLHGHRHPRLDEALKRQVDRVSHTTLLGFSNPPAIELAGRLAEILPLDLSRIFYSDNGSTAVEVALKMAFQFWRQTGDTNRTRFLSLRNAYHGDTLGAVAVGGVDIFHRTFEPMLFSGFKAPSHYCYRCELDLSYPSCRLACAARVERSLEENGSSLAAVVLEPLIQGAGGMISAPPGYLRRVADACRRHGVLLILDEVLTGFGRTGRMFAFEHEVVVPDILCLSKGLSAGYLPLAVTAASERVYEAFLGEFSELKTFFHGHTYTGNPIACSVALASLDVFEEEKVLAGLAQKISYFRGRLEQLMKHSSVGDVRSVGLIAGVEVVEDKETRKPFPWAEARGWSLCHAALRQGLMIRPLGNVVVLMPPLSITMDELRTMMDRVDAALGEAF